MEVRKSDNDYRKYRVLSLDNGIKTLLISDVREKDSNNEISTDEMKLAAAAFCIGVGSFDDPIEVPGLAHFLEHMVFMGSEKYPNENDYDSFLQAHGGSDNATTDHEKTIFYFDIQPEHFGPALDRFAQFFISPLLRENAVDREKKAVDSEFKEISPKDSSRVHQLLSHIARKDHPFSKFLWGNEKSLSVIPKKNNVDVMEKLRKFFHEHYCSRETTLALCSTESLDVLEEMAKKYFSSIKARKTVTLQNAIYNNPFEVEQFNKLYKVTSVKDIHLLELRWILPPQRTSYKKKPLSYISWLLGHECKGSIYALLKNKGYMVSFNAYELPWSTFSMFVCSAELTDEGLTNVEEVVHVIFQYISMLQRVETSKRIYDEITRIQNNYFRYLEPEEPSDYVEELVENMQLNEESDYITGSLLVEEFDPALIKELENSMQTDNVNIMLLSKSRFASMCNEEEPWFGTTFCSSDIPTEWIDKEKCSQVNLELHLPEQNRFIAENFDLNTNNAQLNEFPQDIHDTEYGKIWFKPDDKFLLPKARIYFKLISPIVNKSSYHLMCSDMLDIVLAFNLKELCYEAAVALLDVYGRGTETCREIILDGFNDKLQLLFQNVVDSLSLFDFTDKVFHVSKEKLQRNYKNVLIKSHKFERNLRLSVLQSIHSHPIPNLKELKHITPEKLKMYVKEYFSEMYVESLFQGNITQEEARSYQNYLYTTFKNKGLSKECSPKLQTLNIPKGRTVCRHNGFNKNDPNSVIKNYYQIGPIDLHKFTLSKLLQHIMEEPLFDILRTQEQLGYTVYCDVHDTQGILGISVTVQTEAGRFSPDQVDVKVEEFFQTFSRKLKELTDEQYDTYVTSYITSLKQADLILCEEADRNWQEIFHGEYNFDKRAKMIGLVEMISKAHIEDFLHQYILDDKNVKVLCTQVVGQAKPSTESGDGDSNSGSEIGSSSSDDEDILCDEDCDEVGLKLIHVKHHQYTRCITNLEKFKTKHQFYPASKLVV